MVEIFAEIPDGHPLFARYSFFSSADRAYFADLVARHSERRRSDSAHDHERLIGLALRYSESRHRLGLLDENLQRSLLSARTSFAKMLPLSLRPAIEIYDANQLCAAASVQDNLLFGRIIFDQAGAEAAVRTVVSEVLSERGLDADVMGIGMDSLVDPVANDLTPSQRAAIDLVRCLVRQPDIVVVAGGCARCAAQACPGRTRTPPRYAAHLGRNGAAPIRRRDPVRVRKRVSGEGCAETGTGARLTGWPDRVLHDSCASALAQVDERVRVR
jgi:hypothetical protein